MLCFRLLDRLLELRNLCRMIFLGRKMFVLVLRLFLLMLVVVLKVRFCRMLKLGLRFLCLLVLFLELRL